MTMWGSRQALIAYAWSSRPPLMAARRANEGKRLARVTELGLIPRERSCRNKRIASESCPSIPYAEITAVKETMSL